MIFIIIPVHNRKKFTRDCLLSLKRQTVKDFKVIVVDDGSGDGTSGMIKKEFPETILIYGDGNFWWSKATNAGIEYALKKHTDYILTLNNDTIAASDFIEKMIFWAKKEPEALLGASSFSVETKGPVYGGEIIDWKTASCKPLLDTLEAEDRHGLHEVTHFPGRGLFIPKDVFSKIGLFDAESFPQTLADFDFTHKAIRAGYKVFINYDARLYVYPEESASIKIIKNKSLRNYYCHLFGIKGGANLKRFVLYAFKNCPKRYLIFFLTIGLFRRIFGYLIDWFIETLKIHGRK